jgi:hypothetical protein
MPLPFPTFFLTARAFALHDCVGVTDNVSSMLCIPSVMIALNVVAIRMILAMVIAMMRRNRHGSSASVREEMVRYRTTANVSFTVSIRTCLYVIVFRTTYLKQRAVF